MVRNVVHRVVDGKAELPCPRTIFQKDDGVVWILYNRPREIIAVLDDVVVELVDDVGYVARVMGQCLVAMPPHIRQLLCFAFFPVFPDDVVVHLAWIGALMREELGGLIAILVSPWRPEVQRQKSRFCRIWIRHQPKKKT